MSEATLAKPEMTMVMDLMFAGNTLALTMELACQPQIKDLVETALPSDPVRWSFEDRLAVHLCPELRPHAEAFYARKGPRLQEMLRPTPLRALDEKLLARLCALLEELQPGVMAAIRAAASR